MQLCQDLFRHSGAICTLAALAALAVRPALTFPFPAFLPSFAFFTIVILVTLFTPFFVTPFLHAGQLPLRTRQRARHILRDTLLKAPHRAGSTCGRVDLLRLHHVLSPWPRPHTEVAHFYHVRESALLPRYGPTVMA
jgi:hypothetical protein